MSMSARPMSEAATSAGRSCATTAAGRGWSTEKAIRWNEIAKEPDLVGLLSLSVSAGRREVLLFRTFHRAISSCGKGAKIFPSRLLTVGDITDYNASKMNSSKKNGGRA